jgi:hypothetical protein
MKRSTVSVTGGNFDAVFMAWQEMLGYLPLVLIFDLKEEEDVDAAMVTQIMEKMKISIIIKPKMKQNIKSIMVRGTEKESRLLFEVRRRILGLDETEVPFCCDQHYNRPSTTAAALRTITEVQSTANLAKPTATVGNIWSTPRSTVAQTDAENQDPNAKRSVPPGYGGISEKLGALWAYDQPKSAYPSTSTEESPCSPNTTFDDNIFEAYGPCKPRRQVTSTATSEFNFDSLKQSNSSTVSSSNSMSRFWSTLNPTEDTDDFPLPISANSSRASSIYDCAVARPGASILANHTNEDGKAELIEILTKLDLVRFADRFDGLSVQEFLSLTEARLTFWGFSYTERQTIMGAINRLKDLLDLVRSSENRSMAPGAERKFKGV